MTKTLAATALLATLCLGGCFENTGMNTSCTSHCFSLNGVENDGAEQVDAKIKRMCEDMGRKGKPEIKERTKSAVAGHCPE